MSDDADRYDRVFAIVGEALDHPAGAARDAFLAQACDGDEDLRREVGRLLAAGERSRKSGAFADDRIAEVRSSLETLADAGGSDWLPERIGSYTIVRQIGEGGMGIVYEARQQSPERAVAIKLLHPIDATLDRLRRFRHEAELLGRLQHPGIVQVFEAGMYDVGRGPQPFFAMELVAGVDLRTHCERRGLDARARIELLAQVCEAVHYAHEHGVVHRDIKPDNVLVDELGKPRVLDFGVARATDQTTALSTMLTQKGQIVGTLAYMAPEQLDQLVDEVTPKVDVYALGVVGFELLTGQLPRIVEDLTLTKAIVLLSTTEPARAGRLDSRLRGDVETILGKALESEPDRRYESAAALVGDLRRHLGHLPIRARPPSRIYLVKKFARRHRGLVAGVLVAMLAMLIGTVVSLLFAMQSRRDATLAAENENRAINGLLQSAQVLIDAGRARDALAQLRLVPRDRRGAAWGLLARAAPIVLDVPAGQWHFLDDEHLVGSDGDGVLIYSLADRTMRELFRGSGIGGIAPRPGTGGFVIAQAGHDWLLLDLTNETVLERSPPPFLEGEVPAPAGPLWEGVLTKYRELRTPEVSDDGRTVLWYTSGSEAELRVDGDVVRVVRDLGVLEAAHIGADGRDLVLNRTGAVTVVDIASGSVRLRLENDPERGASGYPVVGGVLLCDAPDYRMLHLQRVWRRLELPDDGEAVEPVDPFAGGFTGPPSYPCLVAYPRDGRFVAVGQDFPGAVDAWLGSTVTGEPLDFAALRGDPSGRRGVLLYPERVASQFYVAPSGHRLVVCSSWAQPAIIELDPREGDPEYDQRAVTLRGHANAEGRPGSGWIYHVAVSNDGRLIASSAPWDPLVRVWDSRTGQQLAALERDIGVVHQTNPGSWESLMAFTAADDRLILTTPYGGKGLCIVDWNLVTGEVTLPVAPVAQDTLHLTMLDAFVTALAPAPRQRLSQRVQMFDGAPLAVFDPPTPGLHGIERPPQGAGWRYVLGVEDDAAGLSVHPGLPHVAVVRTINRGVKEAGRLTVLDARTGTVLVERQLNNMPWCVAYSPDGEALAIGANEQRVLLFETERYTQQLVWQAHESYVYSIAWTPDGERLVTASGDETVRVWDTRTRVASRIDYERWLELRASMAARDDLAAVYASLASEERRAARAELIRRAHAR